MNFCCQVFEQLVKNAGKAGYSVIAAEFGSLQGFFLQARAHDVNQEEKVRSLPRAIDPPRPFYMLMEQGIKFCPFCGGDLHSILTRDKAEIAQLIQEHKKFVML